MLDHVVGPFSMMAFLEAVYVVSLDEVDWPVCPSAAEVFRVVEFQALVAALRCSWPLRTMLLVLVLFQSSVLECVPPWRAWRAS